MKNEVYIQVNEKAIYPTESFDPSVNYPEYQYGDDNLQEQNDIYDMIRECLIGYGLDKENYGTSQWNPLGEYIKPYIQMFGRTR